MSERINNISLRGQRGSLFVTEVSNGKGNPYDRTLVKFIPEGKSIQDYKDPKSGIQTVGVFEAVGVGKVVQSLKMSAKYNSHQGD